MKVLVTGGAGFIGSAVCRLLNRETEWSVVNLDKLTYASSITSLAELDESDRYQFVHGDINDAQLVASLFSHHDFDAVIHLAAETHVDRSITGAAPFVQANIVGVFTMLQVALAHWDALPGSKRDGFRFLHVSTDEVFGSLGPEGKFTEQSRYAPRSPYAASKASADHLVSAWGETYGLPVLISNCSNNYGPYQFPEKLIPLAILNGLNGEPIPVYGDGQQVRDWLHVDDHAAALKLILEQGVAGQTYNVGAECERTNLQVVQAICAELGCGELMEFVRDRPGHDRRYAIDPSKLRTELGWRPRTGFEDGLRQTIAWFRDNREWWEPLRARYSGERLG